MCCVFVGMCVELCSVFLFYCVMCVLCVHQEITSGVVAQSNPLEFFVFCFVCQPPSLEFLTSIILQINKWPLFTSPSLWC